MHLDVVALRDFYYQTGLGRVARRALRAPLAEFWPEARGQTVAGFGFAVPLLRPYLAGARRVIALMPGPQGVMAWPAEGPNVAVLCEETRWPVETGLIDKLVVMHGLETSENPSALLDEAWRCLGPGGRVVFVVPNRTGLWSRREATPFGFGRPYSLAQLHAQLRDHAFTPERHVAALFAPPSQRRFWLRTGAFWERMGPRMWPGSAGGVLVMEATKEVSRPLRVGLRARIGNPLRALDGRPAPVPAPRGAARGRPALHTVAG
ncbi:MAG: methyltransferase domain-containing protein [Rhodobacteraceae bacterium]|nr:methyltransferase domain-containing protein [Paracoccaceae bacterium]